LTPISTSTVVVGVRNSEREFNNCWG
jgi:hypothetical protein